MVKLTTTARLAAILAASALALAACGNVNGNGNGNGDSTSSGGPTPHMTLGLTYVPNIQFAPYYVAVDAGYFEDEGVSVELRHHGQDEDLFGALGQGQEDAVVAGGAEMLQASENGIDAVTFQTLYATYPVSIIVPQDSDIATLADLAGTKLGIPGRFGETWFGTLALLEQAGLTENDVDIIEIGFTQQAALSAGHVDAVIGFVNNDVPQFDSTGLKVRALPQEAVPLVGVGTGASSATIAERGSDLAAIARATHRAVADIAADPQVAIDAAKNHIPGTITPEQEHVMREVIAATIPLYGDTGAGWGQPDLQAWEAMNTFMASVGLISAPVSLADVVTDTINGSN